MPLSFTFFAPITIIYFHFGHRLWCHLHLILVDWPALTNWMNNPNRSTPPNQKCIHRQPILLCCNCLPYRFQLPWRSFLHSPIPSENWRRCSTLFPPRPLHSSSSSTSSRHDCLQKSNCIDCFHPNASPTSSLSCHPSDHSCRCLPTNSHC